MLAGTLGWKNQCSSFTSIIALCHMQGGRLRARMPMHDNTNTMQEGSSALDMLATTASQMAGRAMPRRSAKTQRNYAAMAAGRA